MLNAPLGNGHKLPDALGVYNRPFGMGKGAKADVYKLAYFGNEFALAADRIAEYEAPYGVDPLILIFTPSTLNPQPSTLNP